MSKIGKKNIVIPKESSIKIEGGNLVISGPKGTKKLSINDKIFSSKINETEFELKPLKKDTVRIEWMWKVGYSADLMVTSKRSMKMWTWS